MQARLLLAFSIVVQILACKWADETKAELTYLWEAATLPWIYAGVGIDAFLTVVALALLRGWRKKDSKLIAVVVVGLAAICTFLPGVGAGATSDGTASSWCEKCHPCDGVLRKRVLDHFSSNTLGVAYGGLGILIVLQSLLVFGLFYCIFFDLCDLGEARVAPTPARLKSEKKPFELGIIALNPLNSGRDPRSEEDGGPLRPQPVVKSPRGARTIGWQQAGFDSFGTRIE
eukprot:TRINITY_DN90530_c0_g1_i1.p1 TRINITY_DN90530_c0_g1~~TRINITY_DN90530_c0_g1_i1.p1  ORF type:complete len:230 (+),score=32.48 TRINITY_DN90530_c0_g1_i1:118-807(+)